MAAAESSPPAGCPLCGHAAYTPALTGFDCLYARAENFAYVRCAGCGLVYLHPRPDAARIASFYGAAYEPHGEVAADHLQARLARPLNRFLVRHYLGAQAPRGGSPARCLARALHPLALKLALTPHGTCRLLDVGCGSGGWLYLHHLLGWTATGAELSPTAAAQARSLGLTIHAGTIHDVPAEARCDVISFRHVLEHVPDPVASLAAARARLAPGGRILILVPNFASWGRRRSGAHWYPLDPPRHLLQVTAATLAHAAAAAGLRVVGCHSEVQTRMLVSSHVYARVLGDEFAMRSDPAWRAARIAAVPAYEREHRAALKWRRKLLFLPAVGSAWRGHGETLCAWLAG